MGLERLGCNRARVLIFPVAERFSYRNATGRIGVGGGLGRHGFYSFGSSTVGVGLFGYMFSGLSGFRYSESIASSAPVKARAASIFPHDSAARI